MYTNECDKMRYLIHRITESIFDSSELISNTK